MAASGDFALPRFQSNPAATKPIGIFWLQAGTASLLGDWAVAKIWTYRLASLLGAILSLLITCRAVRTLFGARAALAAATLLAISIPVMIQAHLALTKAPLLVAVVAAQWSLARLYTTPDKADDRGAAFLFWGAQGGGILLGALSLPLLSLATIAGLAVADRRIAWLKRLRPGPGIPLMLLVVAPWFVAVWLAPDRNAALAQWGRDLLASISGPQNINFDVPPGAFLLMAAVGFLPGSAFAVAVGRHAWQARGEAGVRFLLAWSLPYLLALELFSDKPPLYVVQSVFPALAALVALTITTSAPPVPVS